MTTYILLTMFFMVLGFCKRFGCIYGYLISVFIYLRLIRIKIQDLPTVTVAQWVEHLHDKPRALVVIQTSVRFFNSFVAFFLSLLLW